MTAEKPLVDRIDGMLAHVDNGGKLSHINGVELLTSLESIMQAATKFQRCCDRWQDSLGGMHCRECSQKTFAMMHEIQRLLGVGKDGRTEAERAKAGEP